MMSQTMPQAIQVLTAWLIIEMSAFIVVYAYFYTYIHLRFKHTVLGTHISCLHPES